MLGLLHGTTVPDYKGTKFVGNWVNLGGKKTKRKKRKNSKRMCSRAVLVTEFTSSNDSIKAN